MPDNFQELMTAQECADLIAYLLTQKTDKSKEPKKPNFPGGKD
jgi:glycerate kinase